MVWDGRQRSLTTKRGELVTIKEDFEKAWEQFRDSDVRGLPGRLESAKWAAIWAFERAAQKALEFDRVLPPLLSFEEKTIIKANGSGRFQAAQEIRQLAKELE